MAVHWLTRSVRSLGFSEFYLLSPSIDGELEDAFKNNDPYVIIGTTCYHLQMMAAFPATYLPHPVPLFPFDVDELAERLRDDNQRIEAHLIRQEGAYGATGRDCLWQLTSAEPPVDLNRSVFLRAFYEKAVHGSMTTMRFPHTSHAYIIRKDDPLESSPHHFSGGSILRGARRSMRVPRLTQINSWTGVERDLHLCVLTDSVLHRAIFGHDESDSDADRDDDDDRRAAAKKIDVKPLEIPADCDFDSSVPRCPITHEVPSDPHILVGDGHTYEKDNIVRWLQAHDTSPMSGLKLTHAQQHLVPNYWARDVIQAKIDDYNNNKTDTSVPAAAASSSGASSSADGFSWMLCVDALRVVLYVEETKMLEELRAENKRLSANIHHLQILWTCKTALLGCSKLVLRYACERKGLPRSGKKIDLVKRLLNGQYDQVEFHRNTRPTMGALRVVLRTKECEELEELRAENKRLGAENNRMAWAVLRDAGARARSA